MKKTSMAASALLNSIIQLSQYYEERSPLLFASRSSSSELTVTSPRPVMDSLQEDLVFILHTYTHTHTHTHRHTRTVVFFVPANWKTPLCGSVRDDSLPHKGRRPNRRAEDGCKDTHMLTHIITNTSAHADIASKCRGITSVVPRLSLTVFFTQSTPFHSVPHHRHQMFHQRCIFSKLHTLETSVVLVE